MVHAVEQARLRKRQLLSVVCRKIFAQSMVGFDFDFVGAIFCFVGPRNQNGAVVVMKC